MNPLLTYTAKNMVLKDSPRYIASHPSHYGITWAFSIMEYELFPGFNSGTSMVTSPCKSFWPSCPRTRTRRRWESRVRQEASVCEVSYMQQTSLDYCAWNVYFYFSYSRVVSFACEGAKWAAQMAARKCNAAQRHDSSERTHYAQQEREVRLLRVSGRTLN